MDECRQVEVLYGREEGHKAFGFGSQIYRRKYIAEIMMDVGD